MCSYKVAYVALLPDVHTRNIFYPSTSTLFSMSESCSFESAIEDPTLQTLLNIIYIANLTATSILC